MTRNGHLVVEDLEVTYGEVSALGGVSFELAPGGMLALLGANGAGKTSLLRAISGQVPRQGTVTVDGVALEGLPPERIARLGVAHVPEGRLLFGNLTVHENLQTSYACRSKDGHTFHPDEIYDLFPALRPLRKRSAWSLSGGEQQMVAVGRGLCSAPRVLMLDEPTLGLAPIVVEALVEALENLRGLVSLVVVEQSTRLALRLCDDVAVLRYGELVFKGRSDDVRDPGDLIGLYVGQ